MAATFDQGEYYFPPLEWNLHLIEVAVCLATARRREKGRSNEFQGQFCVVLDDFVLLAGQHQRRIYAAD